MTSRTYVASSFVFVSALVSMVAPGCGTDEALPGGTSGGLIDGGGAGGSGNGGGGSGEGGSGGSSGSGPRSAIGTSCLTDDDCPGSELFCIASGDDAFFGGGPQGGICVADCTAGGQDTCAAIDANAVCVENEAGTFAYCLEACFPGTPMPGEVKCHNRLDVACMEGSQPGLGFCRPACAGDFGCGARLCDFGVGVCVDEEDRAEGLPIGSQCDPMATTNPCADSCLGFQGEIGMCSGICTLGTAGCGADPASTDPLDLFCLFSVASARAGDEGACGQVCDCDQDCRHPDFVCVAAADLEDITGRPGYCAAADPEDGMPCEDRPDSGADAGDDASMPEAGTPEPADGGALDAPSDAATAD